MQKPVNDTAYVIPGGHAKFGETNAETLIREFYEEIGAAISVGDLKWVGELFFRGTISHTIRFAFIIS